MILVAEDDESLRGYATEILEEGFPHCCKQWRGRPGDLGRGEHIDLLLTD